MTQEELNKIPRSDPKELCILEPNQTRVLLSGPFGMPAITLTLRRIEGDKAFVQITYDTRLFEQAAL